MADRIWVRLICTLIIHLFFLSAQSQISLYSDSADYKVWKLNISKSSSNICAVFYKKGLVFSSDMETEFGVIHYDKDSKKQLLDLYYSERVDSFSYSQPVGFSTKLNTPFHEGPACFSPDGNTIYYTSSGIGEQKRKLMIYSSHFSNGEWSNPEPIFPLNLSYSVAHPALSPDGQTIYFVSDMSTGFGSTDIFMSKKNNGEWSKPINLGSEINTSGVEKYPFMDSRGVLFFSSNSRGGLGKMDIFSATLKSESHYEVRNLGYPINSKADDFGYSCDTNQIFGFFTSNREDKLDKIYGFYSKVPPFCNCDTLKDPNYCYTFYEENSLLTSDTSHIAYEWDFGHGDKAQGLEVDHCFEGIGDYVVKLNVIDSKTGVLFYNQANYIFTVKPIQPLYFYLPDTIEEGKTYTLNASETYLYGYSIKKHFWKIGTSQIQGLEKTSYVFKDKGTQTIQLGIIAEDRITKKEKIFCTTKKVRVLSPAEYQKNKIKNH